MATADLHFGTTGLCHVELHPERSHIVRAAPLGISDPGQAVRAALEHPLDFPPLGQLFTPGDRVVLALDRNTPRADLVLAEVLPILQQRGVAPENIHILQPAALSGEPADPRTALPAELREVVSWKIHDPTDETQLGYLATTARNERIYLARDLLDADIVISVGGMHYDPVIGFRGTGSVFYPWLSSSAAISHAHGLAHSELDPDDERPLRQEIDEIAWLVGAQFSIQVLPAAGTGVAAVLAGAVESVTKAGKELLAKHWLVETPERVPVVICAVDADAAGHGWDQVGAAMMAARNLVTKGGRIVILSQLHGTLGAGMGLICESRSPRDALQPLRQLTPPDWIAASQLAMAADWAHLYLLSDLHPEAVDSLFLSRMTNEKELQRLLDASPAALLLQSAQHVCGHVASD